MLEMADLHLQFRYFPKFVFQIILAVMTSAKLKFSFHLPFEFVVVFNTGIAILLLYLSVVLCGKCV